MLHQRHGAAFRRTRLARRRQIVRPQGQGQLPLPLCAMPSKEPPSSGAAIGGALGAIAGEIARAGTNAAPMTLGGGAAASFCGAKADCIGTGEAKAGRLSA